MAADPEPGVCILVDPEQQDADGAHLAVDLALLDKQIHELELIRNDATPPRSEQLEGVLNMLTAVYWHLSGGV